MGPEPAFAFPDLRQISGRNWNLGEGGVGHFGKWSFEMMLRIPVDHRNDVWALAITCCELFTGRFAWRCETDTWEVIMFVCFKS